MSNPYTELKNIKYKNMLLSNNNKESINSSQSTINDFLERERDNNKTEPWNRLDVTIKLQKLEEYSINYSVENKLTLVQTKLLSQYLKGCLDSKRFERVKDINYDKETQNIKSIPGLSLNKATKRFTLKRNEKRVSTLKSLAPKRGECKPKKLNISE
jgi:hypothetical protein